MIIIEKSFKIIGILLCVHDAESGHLYAFLERRSQQSSLDYPSSVLLGGCLCI